MNLNHIQNILILAKTLHFTKAAKEANIVQPALSRQVQQIEEELGVNLFNRNKRNVELTPAGDYFIKKMERIMAELEQIAEKMKSIHLGGNTTIRIGFTHSVMRSILPEVLNQIKKLKPNIRTKLREINNKEQYNALFRRELDLSFATNPMVPKGLNWKKLRTDNFVVLLPLSHPVDAKTYQGFSVFANEEFIFPPITDGIHYIHIIESICMDAGFHPKIGHETGSASTSFKLVEAGLGISIEPKTSVQNLDLPLKMIELKDIPQKANLTMVWHDDFAQEFPELLAAIEEIGDSISRPKGLLQGSED